MYPFHIRSHIFLIIRENVQGIPNTERPKILCPTKEKQMADE